MVQILVPISDQAVGSWTTTPLWSKVDDDSVVNPTGDGVVVTSEAVGNNTNTSFADLKLASGTDPAVSTGHIIRVRWSHDNTAARTLAGHVELWQGIPGTGTQKASLDVTPDVTTTENEATLILSGAQADSITDYTDLYVRLWGRGTAGGASRSLIVELVEFEIPNAAAGTTVTPAVIPTTTTVPAPTPTGAGKATPAAVATTSALPAPTPQGAASVNPTEVPTTSTVPTPTPTGGTKVTPSAVATASTLPGPAAQGEALTTPPAVPTSSTVPTPSTSIGKTVTPAVIATLAAIPTATPLGAALVTVSVVGTGSTLPTPTPVTEVMVNPAAIATVTALPTASPQGGGQASPVVILTTVTIPTPTPSTDSGVTPPTIATVSALSTPTPIGGTIVSPALIQTLVDILIPLTALPAVEITARLKVQFYRYGTRLVLAEVGRGLNTGYSPKEGFEPVSAIFAVDAIDDSPGHRERGMISVVSAWATNSGASAATLKAAIDEALQTAGFRAPNGANLV